MIYYWMTHQKPVRTQRGVVLVIALIMLVVMTLMGLSAAQVTGLDERMAGHSRDRDIAFQAAEAALREGERETRSGPPALDGSAGFYPPAEPDSTPRWKTLNWTSSGITYGASIYGVAAAPRYIVEQLPATPSLSAGESTAHDTTRDAYRITTRAVGGSDGTVVVLQTTYLRR